MQFNALLYNTFVVSVLGYIMQLEAFPEQGACQEQQVLRRLAKGPGTWCLKEDLFILKEKFGMAKSFKSIQWLALATKCRVCSFDRACANDKLHKLNNKLSHAKGMFAPTFHTNQMVQMV